MYPNIYFFYYSTFKIALTNKSINFPLFSENLMKAYFLSENKIYVVGISYQLRILHNIVQLYLFNFTMITVIALFKNL